MDHLRQVATLHPDTKVWNMSFNQVGPPLDPDDVSFLGHEISQWARAANVLPVVSVGNVDEHPPNTLTPPADCEAALTVAGRAHDTSGNLLGPCPVSRIGPGPSGLRKPDVSWYSTLRTLGGREQTGSSYSTAIVSALAAHAFTRLRSPTPDLVRALIINATDRDAHDPALGWGSPTTHEPWSCPPGTVTLAWTARLVPGKAYYWEDIPIPPELVHKGKLRGRGSLTAILRPLTSPTAQSNYFGTRLQVALQYKSISGKTSNLLGSMQEEKMDEVSGRLELAKWHPVRRHVRSFRGLSYAGDYLRLHARIFARDLYLNNHANSGALGPQEVAIVLSLSDGTNGQGIYDAIVRSLGNLVESAVAKVEIEQSIE